MNGFGVRSSTFELYPYKKKRDEWMKKKPNKIAKATQTSKRCFGGIWTHNRCINNTLLYQLSYEVSFMLSIGYVFKVWLLPAK